MTYPSDPAEPDPSADLAGPAGPLTADEERQVSALVADALGRGPATAPPDVTARLDEALAGLVAERNAAPTPAPVTVHRDGASSGATVVPLASRRRRLPRALLAAAAVVVGGYAVGNLGLDGLMGAGDDGGSADTASSGDAGGDGAGGGTSRGQLEGDTLERPQDEGMSVVPRVRRDHLAADVRRAVRLVEQLPATRDPAAGEERGTEGGGTVDETSECPVPRLTDEQRLYLVRFADEPAGMVLGPRRAGKVEVTVYSCSTGGVELSRVVPAP